MNATVTPIRPIPSIPSSAMPLMEEDAATVLARSQLIVTLIDDLVKAAKVAGSAIMPKAEGSGSGYGSKPPGSLEIVSITRTMSERLVYWSHEAWMDGLSIADPSTDVVLGTILWRLRDAADELAQWRYGETLVEDLRVLVNMCLGSAYSPMPALHLGLCPVKGPDGLPCGEEIVIRQPNKLERWQKSRLDTEVRCRGCGTVKTADGWRILLQEADPGELVTIPEAARQIHQLLGFPVTRQHLGRLVKIYGVTPDGGSEHFPTFHLRKLLEMAERHRSRHELEGA